jgi:hypothetical protein
MESHASPRTPPHDVRSLRLLAGIAGGLVGGLLFGVVMLGAVIVRLAAINDIGILPFVIRSDDAMIVWLLHLGVSAVFGLLFALVITTRRLRITAPLGVAYGVLLFLVTGALLRPFATDPTPLLAGAALAGHALFGLGLGIVYPLVWREEIGMLAGRDAAGPTPR